jgi:hypothetical protein
MMVERVDAYNGQCLSFHRKSKGGIDPPGIDFIVNEIQSRETRPSDSSGSPWLWIPMILSILSVAKERNGDRGPVWHATPVCASLCV